MLHIATVHYASPLWVEIQTRYLREHISTPYQTWTSLQRIDPSYSTYFDRVIDQAGEQHSKGIEAELRGRLSQRLNFFANYGFTNAAYDEFVSQDGDGSFVEVRGHVPSFVARHTARLWTTYDFPKGFGVSLGGRYLSKRPTDQFNHVLMTGFTTWDTGFYYRRPKMEYDLFITNFLDKTHYFISAINDTQLYPGPPIGISGAVRLHF